MKAKSIDKNRKAFPFLRKRHISRRNERNTLSFEQDTCILALNIRFFIPTANRLDFSHGSFTNDVRKKYKVDQVYLTEFYPNGYIKGSKLAHNETAKTYQNDIAILELKRRISNYDSKYTPTPEIPDSIHFNTIRDNSNANTEDDDFYIQGYGIDRSGQPAANDNEPEWECLKYQDNVFEIYEDEALETLHQEIQESLYLRKSMEKIKGV